MSPIEVVLLLVGFLAVFLGVSALPHTKAGVARRKPVAPDSMPGPATDSGSTRTSTPPRVATQDLQPSSAVPDEALSSLIAALGAGNDIEVRTQAARALGNTGSQTAVDALVESLQDTDSGVRRVAMESLIKIGGLAQPPVEALLVSGDRSVERNTLMALTDAVRFGNWTGDARAAKFVGGAARQRYLHGREFGSMVDLLRILGDPRAKEILAAVDRDDVTTMRDLLVRL
jgi:hypothetical protein